MIRNIITFILINFSFITCKQESVSIRSAAPYTIDMSQLFEDAEETPDFKWNDLAERVDLVPLGKTERILSNLSVQGLTDDGKVLLVDMANGTITVADIESGKIISSFNRVGRAGNEYLMPSFGGPISANIYDDKISFYSEGVNKRIQVYDLYGRHLKSIDVKTDEYIRRSFYLNGLFKGRYIRTMEDVLNRVLYNKVDYERAGRVYYAINN